MFYIVYFHYWILKDIVKDFDRNISQEQLRRMVRHTHFDLTLTFLLILTFADFYLVQLSFVSFYHLVLVCVSATVIMCQYALYIDLARDSHMWRAIKQYIHKYIHSLHTQRIRVHRVSQK